MKPGLHPDTTPEAAEGPSLSAPHATRPIDLRKMVNDERYEQ